MGGQRHTVSDLAAIHRRALAGESVAEIARSLGEKPDTVHKRLRRAGFPPIGWRGPDLRVVTPDLLLRVRRRVVRGERVRTIARELGINPNTLASAYRRAGHPNPHPGGHRRFGPLLSEFERACRNWRIDPRGRRAVDWILEDLARRVTWERIRRLAEGVA